MPSNEDGESPGSMASITAGGTLPKKVDYPLPPDPNSPRPDDNTILDMGLKQGTVGHDGSAHSYGLSKGEVRQDAQDDSIAGQGFGK